jgi:acyl-CoA oxidase
MAHHPESSRGLERVSILAGHLADNKKVGEHCLSTNPTLAASRTPEFEFAQNMAIFPPAKHDALFLDELLTPEERALRLKVRAFAEREIAPVVADYWERAEFPHSLVPKMAALGIGGGSLKGHGCQGLSLMACAMAGVELARVDGSMSTFYLVHTYLATLTVGLLGSEQQKQELLPDMATFKKVGCWALTEPSNGSDAAALQTTARRVQGGWLLNGRKRWIGNGTCEHFLVSISFVALPYRFIDVDVNE